MEILNNFHPMYLIFPLILVFSCLFKNTRLKAVILTIAFVLVFICAETGADYLGYKYIYDNCLKKEVHGEFLFIAICKGFNKIHISYNLFRVIFLTTFMSVFTFSLCKLTKNFSLSFLIAYLSYIVYFVSAYRQFATMAILLLTVYLYFYKKQRILSILLNLVAVFIHKLAIIQFLIFVVLFIYQKMTKREKAIEKFVLRKNFIYIILGCLVVRFIAYILLSYTVLGAIYSGLVDYPQLSLINFGLISRLVVLMLLTHFYIESDESNETNIIFSIYFIGMLLYIAFPAELIMGRLINNVKLLEIVLIPILMFKQYGNMKPNTKHNKNIVKFSQIMIVFVLCLVFCSQMINQVGYGTYSHMLLEVINDLRYH